MSYQDISFLIFTEIVGDFGFKKFADKGGVTNFLVGTSPGLLLNLFHPVPFLINIILINHKYCIVVKILSLFGVNLANYFLKNNLNNLLNKYDESRNNSV